MANQELKELYIDELRDLFNAENQLVKALPKLAKAADSEDLRAGFEKHLEQTKGHVERLETIFKSMDENSKGKKCKGMEGLVEEGSEAIEEYEGSVEPPGEDPGGGERNRRRTDRAVRNDQRRGRRAR